MYCGKCGTETDASGRCPKCSPAQAAAEKAVAGSPAAQSKPKFKLPISTLITGIAAIGLAIALVLVLVLGGGGTATTSTSYSGGGFATPEAAIQHFASAVKNNDMQGALKAFAIDEYAEGYDFTAYADRMKAIMPMTMMAPSEYKMYSEGNKATAAGGYARNIMMFAYSFSDVKGLDGTIVTKLTSDDISAYAKAVDPAKLSALSLQKVDVPKPKLMDSPTNVKNFAAMAKVFGASELTERVALYELDGEYYLGGFQLMHFGSGWKITRLSSALAGTPAYGTVQKITPEDYEDLIR